MIKSILCCAVFSGIALPVATFSASPSEAPAFPCLNPPAMTAEFPGDTLLSDQQSFNCFAWQEFIAANWPAGDASAGGFGKPGDTAPVVWETYMNVHDLLNADGTPPPPWGSTRGAPARAGDNKPRILSRTAKLGDNFDPSKDINEAAPSIAWLADTGGNLVWYEIVVNQAEYDYFVSHGYYNADRQLAAVEVDGRVDLPMGTFGGDAGAIEFKAAWLSVPDPENTEKWSRYKLSVGTFCTEVGTPEEFCDRRKIALIGLHILHKTASQPSWTWATFEHVDNVPDAAAVAGGKLPDRDYNFYQANCTPRNVPRACSARVAMTSCEPNTSPAYALGSFRGSKVARDSLCQPYPIQVTRVFPLPNTNENPVVATNAAAQTMIARANPKSVFQYYQLINVLWSDSPVNENDSPAIAGKSPAPHAPLSKTGFRPGLTTFPVANPVLETYVQDISCLECHSGASIAQSETFASDYSFIFGMAGPKKGPGQ